MISDEAASRRDPFENTRKEMSGDIEPGERHKTACFGNLLG